MFFMKKLTHTIQLHPSYFGPKIQEVILQKLYADVEGTTSGKYGYIVAVNSIDNLTDLQAGSRVVYGTGEAEFTLHYSAIVMKPFKGEVVDAIVDKVGKLGFFAYLGPMQIFVSTFYIPDDLRFQPESNPPSFVSDQAGESIKRGSKVRIRLMGIRTDQTELFAIGSIKGDFLGLLDQ
ncbi:DNA-directed RNA polymerase II subunit [Naganishia albida]|nr:DNA-directed RNA polymerase II subunit [Naganishia albida]